MKNVNTVVVLIPARPSDSRAFIVSSRVARSTPIRTSSGIIITTAASAGVVSVGVTVVVAAVEVLDGLDVGLVHGFLLRVGLD